MSCASKQVIFFCMWCKMVCALNSCLGDCCVGDVHINAHQLCMGMFCLVYFGAHAVKFALWMWMFPRVLKFGDWSLGKKKTSIHRNISTQYTSIHITVYADVLLNKIEIFSIIISLRSECVPVSLCVSPGITAHWILGKDKTRWQTCNCSGGIIRPFAELKSP